MSARPPPDRQLAAVHAGIRDYYTRKISSYGATPPGVDWSGSAGQEARFVQLLTLCNFADPFSLNDVGCGYGALFGWLAKRHADTKIDYLGIDLSPAMIRHAKRLWRNHGHAVFATASTVPRAADYSVASGIFNVKLDQPIGRWEGFVAQTLIDMHATSRQGFAVNFMAPETSDREPEPGLYRPSPEQWIRYCEQDLGSSVELVTGYGLDDFTLLVRP